MYYYYYYYYRNMMKNNFYSSISLLYCIFIVCLCIYIYIIKSNRCYVLEPDVFKSNLSTQKMCVSNLNVLYVDAQSINAVLNQHSININQSINTRSTIQYSIHTHSINQSMSTINTQSINQQYSTQSTINQSIDQQNSTQSTRNRSTI